MSDNTPNFAAQPATSLPAAAPAPASAGFSHPVPIASLSGEQAAAELAHIQREGSSYWQGDKIAVARAIALRTHGMTRAEAEAAASAAPAPPLALPGDENFGPTASAFMIDSALNNGLSLPGADMATTSETREVLGKLLMAAGGSTADAGIVATELGLALRDPDRYADAASAERALVQRLGQHGAAREIAQAKAALSHLEGKHPGTKQYLLNAKLGNSPAVVAVLARAGRRLGLAR